MPTPLKIKLTEGRALGVELAHGRRKAFPSPKTAKQWGLTPRAIRRHAFWSARLEEANHAAELKQFIAMKLRGESIKVKELHSARWTPEQLVQTVDPATGNLLPAAKGGIERGEQEVLVTRDLIMREMRKRALERELAKPFSSPARIALIVDMAEGLARGKNDFDKLNQPENLLAFPAQEFLRIEYREEPRDWDARWENAAEAIGWEGVYKKDGGETKIARRDSPIWCALSAFGEPFPPYDYNSGMGVRPIERRKALRLKLLGEGEMIKNPGATESEELRGSVKNLGKTDRAWLKKKLVDELGGDVRITPAGEIVWQAPPPTPEAAAKREAAEAAEAENARIAAKTAIEGLFAIERGEIPSEPGNGFWGLGTPFLAFRLARRINQWQKNRRNHPPKGGGGKEGAKNGGN